MYYFRHAVRDSGQYFTEMYTHVLYSISLTRTRVRKFLPQFVSLVETHPLKGSQGFRTRDFTYRDKIFSDIA